MFARILIPILWLLASCSPVAEDARPVATRVDTLFSGGMVFDGSGSAPVAADIGVNDGKIVFIGNAESSNVAAEDFGTEGHHQRGRRRDYG